MASKSPEARERFRQWADECYDVVWFSKAMTYHLLGRPKLGPTIVDLDDLEDRKIGHGSRPKRLDPRRSAPLLRSGRTGPAECAQVEDVPNGDRKVGGPRGAL